ncbi:DUF3331 domain-containing protein [Mitsuaria sp. GD03876]|uniref:DUF3331 domain-containing protein n=1 Tax=Mitsuaria sp. GD03876 TaxID=2975399 RepID=UPI0024479538|nr:DUF3331 domain-containing protein [Mitsuaria sp. GD03876]MDH0867332.1 DUF3331 domain-containing protein [Mitsuaria sp. GD03876]
MHSDLASDPTRDGWLRTVSWLGNGGIPEPQPQPASNSARRIAPTIHVLDRPTPRTAAISWSDPGACHYGYQIWDMLPSKRDGTCVLSGSTIRVGDMIYTPRVDEPSPINAGEMIAVAYVDA